MPRLPASGTLPSMICAWLLDRRRKRVADALWMRIHAYRIASLMRHAATGVVGPWLGIHTNYDSGTTDDSSGDTLCREEGT